MMLNQKFLVLTNLWENNQVQPFQQYLFRSHQHFQLLPQTEHLGFQVMELVLQQTMKQPLYLQLYLEMDYY